MRRASMARFWSYMFPYAYIYTYIHIYIYINIMLILYIARFWSYMSRFGVRVCGLRFGFGPKQEVGRLWVGREPAGRGARRAGGAGGR